MLDRAARMAAATGENALSRQNRETAKALMATGMSAEQAAEYAGARVFSTAPGNYGFAYASGLIVVGTMTITIEIVGVLAAIVRKVLMYPREL